MPVPLLLQGVEQAAQARMGLEQLVGGALEMGPPFGGDRVRVPEVLLEQTLGEARVEAFDVVHAHLVLCSNTRAPPREPSATRARGW